VYDLYNNNKSTVLSVKHQQSIYIIIEQQAVNKVFAHELCLKV